MAFMVTALLPLAAALSGPAAAISHLAEIPVFAAAQRRRSRYSVSIKIGKPAPALPLPAIEGDDATLPLVVIDAGHGGHDPGAVAEGAREKDLTLALAKALRRDLIDSGRVRVALTRDDDSFLVLEERFGIARRLGADLFVSLHADGAENTAAHGATVYTLSETASDREAALLAARENRSDIIHGVDLGGKSDDIGAILIDLSQRETMRASADFARLLVREARDDFPFRQVPHRMAGLIVLKAPDMPSALVEAGYITNAADANFLASREGQRRVARGIAQAVIVHFAKLRAER
ncbi:MAG: N-acetylmuramoyl-L-alanine amidase [Sphingomonadales bacterium]|nr:N-acetylmuramoyl-L-alanine amidase [Sphingomonadales bacterium]